MRRRTDILLPALLLLLAAAVPAAAQPDPTPPHALPRPDAGRSDWPTRLGQIDRLIRMGSLGRAVTMLESLEKTGAPASQILPRRVAVAAAEGDQRRVVDLCRQGLAERPRSLVLLRPLAEALMKIGDVDSARVVVVDLLAVSPNRISAANQVVEQWRAAGRPAEGLALCDALRAEPGAAAVLQRPRARCLLDVGRVEEALAEFLDELDLNPMNLPMARKDLLDGLPDDAARRRAVAFLRDAPAGRDPAAPALLRADLLLSLGDDVAALAAVTLLLPDRTSATQLLRHASMLLREAPLEPEPRRARAQWSWLLAVLEGLGTGSGLQSGQRPRVLDLLAGAAENALAAGYLDADPQRAEARIEAVLDQVRQGSPGSSRLYSAQVRLARHTRDVRREPARAAARLERLLVDLDLPLEGVALCRLELGLSRMAAGDTAAARTVLTRLGRDGQFREAAGHAHFQLARLDLAQGHWDTARERLSAVALDNAGADFANDALDLALLAAEEQARGAAPAFLAAYSACMAREILGDEAGRREALQAFLAAAEPADVGSSMLVSRARLELAALEHDAGRPARAAELCALVVRDRPDGPYAARALYEEGALRAEAGDPGGAARAWERLLAQYPDGLEAEDARRRLRELP